MIDFSKLLTEFKTRGWLIREFYYVALIEDEGHPVRPFVDWLDYNDFSVVAKLAKEFIDAIGRRKIKTNMEVEIAVDAMELGPHGASVSTMPGIHKRVDFDDSDSVLTKLRFSSRNQLVMTSAQ